MLVCFKLDDLFVLHLVGALNFSYHLVSPIVKVEGGQPRNRICSEVDCANSLVLGDFKDLGGLMCVALLRRRSGPVGEDKGQ